MKTFEIQIQNQAESNQQFVDAFKKIQSGKQDLLRKKGCFLLV